MKKLYFRVIDANLNRIREGLRVCEDIARFVLNDHKLTKEFKKLRVDITKGIIRLSNKRNLPLERELLKNRDVESDLLRVDPFDAGKRQNAKDIFFANMQRIKESARVLEEFGKLFDKDMSIGFKKIRFITYKIEKDYYRRLSSFIKRI